MQLTLDEALDPILDADHIDGEKLRADAEKWQEAADQAEIEGDTAAHLWRETARRATCELACYGSGFENGRREGYEEGRRAFVEHMPADLISEYWARFEAAHERSEG